MKRIASILILALLAVGCGKTYKMDAAISTAERPWPYFRGSQMAAGAVHDGSYSGRLDIIWEEGSNDKPSGPLTLSQEALVYPSSRKRIKMYAIDNGEYLGRINTKGWPDGGMAVWQALGWYVVGHRKNELRGVDLTRRKQIWAVDLYNPLPGVLFLEDKKVIAGSVEGYLMAVDHLQGERIWKFQADDHRFGPPPIYTGSHIVQATDNGILLLIDPENGSEIGRIELDGAVVSPMAVDNGVLYANDLDGGVYAVDIDSREIIWKQQIEGPVWTSPAVADGFLYVAGSTGSLLAFNAATGALRWSVEIEDVIGASPIVAGDYVIFGSKAGTLYSLRTADGKVTARRQFKGSFSVSPVTNGDFIYIATDKGEIASLGTATRPGIPLGTMSAGGTVVDEETGQPIAGAAVIVQGTSLGQLTDQNGTFELTDLSSEMSLLTVSAIGYARKEVRIDLGSGSVKSIVIKLESDDALLETGPRGVAARPD